MTKAELAQMLCEKVGFSRADAIEIVETALEIIKENLVQGENVKICGFGAFIVRSKHERVGRNPHTGDELKIAQKPGFGEWRAGGIFPEQAGGRGNHDRIETDPRRSSQDEQPPEKTGGL